MKKTNNLLKKTPLLQHTNLIFFGISLVLFYGITVYAAFFAELGFDQAYHATVAKNFVNGYGWASSYHNAFVFNPDVTTGPTLLLPTALLIYFFGNALWVPALSAALLHLILLACVLWVFSRQSPDKKEFYLASTILLLCFLIIEHPWWYSLIGDLAAALMIVIAIGLMALPVSNKTGFAIGLSTALALGAKMQGVFVLPAILWFFYQNLKTTNKKPALWLIIGLLTATLPWLLFKHLSLDTLPANQLAEHQFYARDFFISQGSGILELINSNNIWQTVSDNIQRNFKVLAEHYQIRYNIPWWCSLLFISSPILLAGFSWLKKRPISTSVYLYIITAFLYFSWYFFISFSWRAKNSFTGIIIISLLLVLLGCTKKFPKLLLALPLILALTVPKFQQQILQQKLLLQTPDNRYNSALLATRDFIHNNQQHYTFMGCGWPFAPWALEYLLPASENFRECGRTAALVIQAEQANASATLNRSALKPPALVINRIFWNHSPYAATYLPLLQSCQPPLLFHSEPLAIVACDFDNSLQAFIQQIVEPESQFHYIHKPHPVSLQ